MPGPYKKQHMEEIAGKRFEMAPGFLGLAGLGLDDGGRTNDSRVRTPSRCVARVDRLLLLTFPGPASRSVQQVRRFC